MFEKKCAREDSNFHGNNSHYPLKLARLPIPPRAQKLCRKKKLRHCLTFCDLAGARTQDPLLKREMLYQLSYQVGWTCFMRLQR